jgi:argininosuccinate synthase
MYTLQKNMLEKMVLPQDAPDMETRIVIHFKNGIPVKLINKEDGTVKEDAYEMYVYLNELAGKNGIGLLDMVENRFVGIKSRGVYETPAATVLHIAHKDIEGIAMDREVMRLVNMLTPKFAEIIYNGFWFSPEMDFLMAAIEKSQELIDGSVHLCLYKGNVIVEGRESPSSLYNKKLSSMDIEGGFDQTDSKGFIRINAIRLMAHRAILEESQKK